MKKSYEEKMVVREWMVNSLLDLMKTIPFDDITITQITHRAGVSRMTYYRNYVKKEDILINYTQYLTTKFASSMKDVKNLNNKVFIQILFDFCLEYESYFCTLIYSKKAYILLDSINATIEKIEKNPEKVYYDKYFAGAIFNVLLSWLQDKSKKSNEISELLNKLTDSSLFNHTIELYHDSF